MTGSRPKKVFALVVVVLLVGTGGVTHGVLLDSEVATANVDGDGRETSVGGDHSNPVGVCLGNVGNTGCEPAMIGLLTGVSLPDRLAPARDLSNT